MRLMASTARTILPYGTLCGLLLSLLSTTAWAQHHLYTTLGDAKHDAMGDSVCGIGDVNKDGHADFAVGASAASNPAKPGYVRVFSGRSGRVLYTVVGDKASDAFGWSVCGLGDINGDSRPDFVVGALSTTSQPGYVRAFSGVDGAILWSVGGDNPFDFFGISVAAIGDANRDGIPDVLVGASQSSPKKGYARVLSGKDGKVLATFTGAAAGDAFGIAVAGVGDLDADGIPDLAIGASQVGKGAGYVRVLSAQGKVLYTLHGDAKGDWFGDWVQSTGDVNRDGRPDLIVGAPNGLAQRGYARVFSGKDGSVLHTVNGVAAGDFCGKSAAGTGDVDKDGWPDFLIGSPWANNKSGTVRVHSGKDASVLRVYQGKASGKFFGWRVAAAGDINRDGRPDSIVGGYGAVSNNSSFGTARVLSGAALSLTTDTHLISLATGGSQSFRLDAGSVHANKIYLLLGTMSGTTPGIVLGPGVTLPLNLDTYLLLTAANPNTLIIPSLATLDSAGKATAKLTLPPGLPQGLAGTLLDHAFLVIDLSTSSFDFASNSVPLTLMR